ncbi:MAG: hypothetical protein MZV64_48460 [Ignavibacteriales bacterium]|nr:hypothetical protein [Ignavibacteriales bacterium]
MGVEYISAGADTRTGTSCPLQLPAPSRRLEIPLPALPGRWMDGSALGLEKYIPGSVVVAQIWPDMDFDLSFRSGHKFARMLRH